MELETVRDFIDFNSDENPNLDFITCPNTRKKTSNKSLKKNLEKINYYLSVEKKQKKNSLICTLTENSKRYSAYAGNNVLWNDTGAS